MSPAASSWEDKVNSFLATTKTAPSITTSLVEITLNSEILPTDFDPSKPPPGMAAVVPPDYAIPNFETEEVAVDIMDAITHRSMKGATDMNMSPLTPQLMRSHTSSLSLVPRGAKGAPLLVVSLSSSPIVPVSAKRTERVFLYYFGSWP